MSVSVPFVRAVPPVLLCCGSSISSGPRFLEPLAEWLVEWRLDGVQDWHLSLLGWLVTVCRGLGQVPLPQERDPGPLGVHKTQVRVEDHVQQPAAAGVHELREE